MLATVKGDVHDIGKNLVDIILTNNGYEVHNLGIKISITEMIDKALEVKADAIGMSGLLVKSTLIMRDNLEELNDRDLADIPVLLGGAALTRTYVERDLREVYEGRLFYGKDAFEGLRGDGPPRRDPPHRRGRPRMGTRPGRPGPPAAQHPPGTGRPSELPGALARGGDRQRGVRPAVPRLQGGQGHRRSTRSPSWINETALFRNQWQFRPEKHADGSVETDEHFKDRIRPILREQLAGGEGRRPARAPGRVRLLPRQRRRQRPGDLDRRVPHRRGRTRFPYPRQRKDPFLCIADFFRPLAATATGAGELDYAAFHIVTMGEAVSQRCAELFAADQYQDYLLLHGLGVEMAEALAEFWHRRIREEWGFADEDPDGAGPRPDQEALVGLFRQKYRGGRYSWGYPACPDLEDNEKVAELLGARRASACSAPRRPASSTSPSRPPPRSSATTPGPSTSSPADRPGSTGPTARRSGIRPDGWFRRRPCGRTPSGNVRNR